MGLDKKCLQALKKGAPTSKSPEEREFVVDSVAFMHVLRKWICVQRRTGDSAEIQDTTVLVTANGKVHTNVEAQVYVHDLGLIVTVQLLEDTLPVLSLGRFCEEHGYSFPDSRKHPDSLGNGTLSKNEPPTSLSLSCFVCNLGIHSCCRERHRLLNT